MHKRRHLLQKRNSSLRHGLIFPVMAIFLGIIIVLVGLEIILHFFPVCETPASVALNDKQPYPHREPNRTGIWSICWNFCIVNKIHSNNYGFINDRDYSPNEESPLLAVIGDSFVEALMVPYQETIQGRLAKILGKAGRVYSFALSGAGLSQYLNFAEYANKIFKPAGMVFVIIPYNDFNGSLYKYEQMPGAYYFFEDPNSKELILNKVNIRNRLFKRLLRKSRLLLYLRKNIDADLISKVFLKVGINSSKTVVPPIQEFIIDSKRAVDTFFKKLPDMSGLDSSHITFVLDAIREVIYRPEKSSQLDHLYSYIMRQYFIAEATKLGYEVIDMQNVFEKHYRQNKKRFEFPCDYHWSGIGHGVVADAVIKSNVFKSIFKTKVENISH